MLSKQYRRLLEQMHSDPDLRWGNDGKYRANEVATLAAEVAAQTVLDFGCGRSSLSKTLKLWGSQLKVTDYDPGRPKKATLPEGVFDLVTCTDVMEHVEPEHVDEVLSVIERKAKKAAFFVIDCVPARATLPDGRNAHLTVHPAAWWEDKVRSVFVSPPWRIKPESTVKNVVIRCTRT